MIIEVTKETFEQEVVESELPTVVYFSAAWCNPCRAMKPMIENAAREFEEKAKFVKIDVDHDGSDEITQEFGVRGIPTLAIVKHGVVIDTSVGAKTQAQISAWLMTNL